MSDYKIKLEDKAAFLNRLDKAGIEVDSYKVADNKFEGYFEFTTDDPITDNIVKTILKQSPKINKLKEMSKLTKSQLAEIIREELASMKGKKKKQLDEASIAQIWDMLYPAAIIAGSAGAAFKLLMKDAKNNIKAQLQKQGKEVSEEELEALATKAIKGQLDDTTGANK
jgi:Glu-tRNA(Gln) amidotransferase subunit E-like FAD-binding protein